MYSRPGDSPSVQHLPSTLPVLGLWVLVATASDWRRQTVNTHVRPSQMDMNTREKTGIVGAGRKLGGQGGWEDEVRPVDLRPGRKGRGRKGGHVPRQPILPQHNSCPHPCYQCTGLRCPLMGDCRAHVGWGLWPALF